MTSFSSITWFDGYLSTIFSGTFSVTLPATSAGDLLIIGQMSGDGNLPVSGPTFNRSNGTASQVFWRHCDGTESGGTVTFGFGVGDGTRVASPTHHWSAFVAHYTSPQGPNIDVLSASTSFVTGDATHKAKATDDFSRSAPLYIGLAPQGLLSFFMFCRGGLSTPGTTPVTVVSNATNRSTQTYGAPVTAPVVYNFFDTLDVRNDAGITSTWSAEAPAVGAGSASDAHDGVWIRNDQPFYYDVFADAVEVSCGAAGPENNTGYEKESGEPNHAGDAGGHSVWYKIVPTEDETITFTMDPAGFTGLIGVYTGSAVNALTEVTSDSGDPASVTWDALNGVTYYIAMDGAGGAEGDFDITLDCVVPSVSPNNGEWGYWG